MALGSLVSVYVPIFLPFDNYEAPVAQTLAAMIFFLDCKNRNMEPSGHRQDFMYSLNTDFLNRIQPHLRICKSNLFSFSPFLPFSFLSFFFCFCFLLSNELLFWGYQKYEGRSIPLKEFYIKLRFLSLKTVLAQQHKPGFRVRSPGYGVLPVIYIHVTF